MPDRNTNQELQDRLNLIENMIAEGRRVTENWGWTFVLWGVAYYVAFAWSAWGHSTWVWPVTMLLAVVGTVVGSTSKKEHAAATTLGRAIGSIWVATGMSMFLLFLSLGISGKLADPHLFAAVVSAILGIANGASALLLRWRLQLATAIVWWIAAVATCFGTATRSTIILLVAIFLCQIVFGIYGMVAGLQTRRRSGAIHA
jgi:hypothetical protein